ncbi:hypothetical protein [Nocardia mangyaensis]|nr:hypothetical protein [Nocardia mangyaensis]MDO3650649.1 hypothetical protein [Nocardia mangyaensis]
MTCGNRFPLIVERSAANVNNEYPSVYTELRQRGITGYVRAA